MDESIRDLNEKYTAIYSRQSAFKFLNTKGKENFNVIDILKHNLALIMEMIFNKKEDI